MDGRKSLVSGWVTRAVGPLARAPRRAAARGRHARKRLRPWERSARRVPGHRASTSDPSDRSAPGRAWTRSLRVRALRFASRSSAQPLARGVEVVGDIELFGREVARSAPGARVLGITGTNGKSTVTAMAGAMARARRPAHGGGRQHRPAGAGRARARRGPRAHAGALRARAVQLPARDHVEPARSTRRRCST